MSRVMAVVLAAALGAGCFKVTYTNPMLPPNGQVVEGTSSFYILALLGDQRIPAYQMCPTGVSQIRTGLSFTDLVLHVVTIGIYTPRSYRIECGGGR